MQSVERFFKSALVDRFSAISSASLISSYHLFTLSPSIIKRWANETQEAVNAKGVSSGFGGASGYLGGSSGGYQAIASTSYIMQYHALGLLYLMREKDRMAVTKMVQQFGAGGKGGNGVVKNPLAICMLIRFARKVMDDDSKSVQAISDFPYTGLALTSIASKSRCMSTSRGFSDTNRTWSTSKQLEQSARCGESPPRSSSGLSRYSSSSCLRLNPFSNSPQSRRSTNSPRLSPKQSLLVIWIWRT